jgi:hypothetical protein
MASAVNKNTHELTIEPPGPQCSKADSDPPVPQPSPSGNTEASDEEDATQHMVTSTLSNSSATTPPYWKNTNTHQRNISSLSADSFLPAGAITLLDNDTSEHDDRNSACWAKSVEIVDYTVVNGGATSVGAFVVWNVRVETLTVHGVPFLPPKVKQQLTGASTNREAT